jgi:hypothetical protein
MSFPVYDPECWCLLFSKHNTYQKKPWYMRYGKEEIEKVSSCPKGNLEHDLYHAKREIKFLWFVVGHLETNIRAGFEPRPGAEFADRQFSRYITVPSVKCLKYFPATRVFLYDKADVLI